MDPNGGKKKMPTVAWVGIGCGGVALVGVIVMVFLVSWCKGKVEDVARDLQENPAKAMAEIAVRANPEVELVRSDDAAGTITIREKKTGKVTTLNFEDVKNGKFTVESGGTTATIDGKTGSLTAEGPGGTQSFNVGGLEKMPEWFEVPENVKDWKSVSHTERAGKVNGMVTGQSDETLEVLLEDFEEKLKAAGFTRTSRTENQTVSVVSYSDEPKKRTVAVLLTSGAGAGGVKVQVTYTQR